MTCPVCGSILTDREYGNVVAVGVLCDTCWDDAGRCTPEEDDQ